MINLRLGQEGIICNKYKLHVFWYYSGDLHEQGYSLLFQASYCELLSLGMCNY